MQITVVTPTYNEAENLPRLVCSLFALPLEGVKLLIVDDNSPDGTGQIAERLSAENPGRITVIHRTGKLGLGTAYITGFQKALEEGAEGIVQMDADFSHSPAALLDLHKAIDGCDFVIGSRYVAGGKLDEKWPIWRKMLSGFGNLYARVILGSPIRDLTGGFRLWRRETLLGMPLQRVRSNGYIFQVEMGYIATRLGYKPVEVPIYFAERTVGTSKMSFRIQLEAALRVWSLRRAYRDLTPVK